MPKKRVSDRIAIFKDADKKYRFHVKGINGEIVATSEAYQTKAHAERGARDLIAIILHDAADSVG